MSNNKPSLDNLKDAVTKAQADLNTITKIVRASIDVKAARVENIEEYQTSLNYADATGSKLNDLLCSAVNEKLKGIDILEFVKSHAQERVAKATDAYRKALDTERNTLS